MTAPPEVGHEIPDDVLAIADVVLNARPHQLDRGDKALALSAMNALGYSNAHMSQALAVHPSHVAGVASKLGVRLDRDRHWVDQGALDFIAQGVPMKVTGTTADAAVRLLAQRGLTAAEAARLMLVGTKSVTNRAEKLGVVFAPAESYAWWSTYCSAEPNWAGKEKEN